MRRAHSIVALAVIAVTSAPTRARASRGSPPCVETSDVVGETKCSRYGDGWTTEARVPLSMSLSAEWGAESLAGRTLAYAHVTPRGAYGTIDGDALPAQGATRTTAYALDLAYGLGRFAYVGAGFAYARGDLASGHVESGAWSADVDGRGAFTAGRCMAIAGLRIPLGRVTVRGEARVGLESARLALASMTSPGDPPQGSGASLGAVSPIVAPRVAVDVWLGPWTTLSAFASEDLSSPSTRAFGLALAWHLRAYDGEFSL